jgi:magnesium chelatase subunit D
VIGLADEKNPSTIPFPAIVGQVELKQALLAVAANPALGGLLVQGEKGTAKSTAVRALIDLLPDQRAVADCPYGCSPDDSAVQCESCRERDDSPIERRSVPLVTVPLGATRERVVGTLSVADALEGERAFAPGLLARAHRGFLYVDEVNLLDDHLVDVLLDATASGVNRVERDGISITHPADFTLIGTMNPEEGDLRPQLLDRFALQATVVGCEDVDDRVEIIERVLDSGRDPTAFAGKYDEAMVERTEQVITARHRLDSDAVDLPASFKTEIAELCRDAGTDGHRADIAIARTAMTFAALDDRPKVLETDIQKAAGLAFSHRLRNHPFEDAPDPQQILDDHFDGENGDDGTGTQERNNRETENEDDGAETDDGNQKTDCSPNEDEKSDTGTERNNRSERSEPEKDGEDQGQYSEVDSGGGDRSDNAGDDSTDSDADGTGLEEGDQQQEGTPLVPGQARAGIGDARAPAIAPSSIPKATESDGSRAVAEPSTENRGARVRTEHAHSSESIDAATSVRTAARRGSDRVESRDLRRSVRSGTGGSLVVFAVDTSASMRSAMRAAKGTVLELLKDTYEQRDRVAFVAFAGENAEVLLPPTDSATLAARHLKELPTGDRTPLPDGLRTTGEVITRAGPTASVVVLVTDGRANVADGSPTEETRKAARQLGEHAHVVVVDANTTDANQNENRTHSPGLCHLVAEETGGEYVPLSALSADRIDRTVSLTN